MAKHINIFERFFCSLGKKLLYLYLTRIKSRGKSFVMYSIFIHLSDTKYITYSYSSFVHPCMRIDSFELLFYDIFVQRSLVFYSQVPNILKYIHVWLRIRFMYCSSSIIRGKFDWECAQQMQKNIIHGVECFSINKSGFCIK